MYWKTEFEKQQIFTNVLPEKHTQQLKPIFKQQNVGISDLSQIRLLVADDRALAPYIAAYVFLLQHLQDVLG